MKAPYYELRFKAQRGQSLFRTQDAPAVMHLQEYLDRMNKAFTLVLITK